MDWFDITFIILLILGTALLIHGFWKKRPLFILFGGMAFIAPIFHFVGWTPAIPFAAPIALAILLLWQKVVNPAKNTNTQ